MTGDVTIRNGHGPSKVGSVARTLRVRQSHGNLTVESAESDTTIDVQHSRPEMGSAAANVALRNSHGDARIGTVGKDINTFSEHGNLTLAAVSGSVEGRLRHTKIQLNEGVAGNVVLDSSDGSIDAEPVSGRFDLNGSYTPVSVRHIEKDTSIIMLHAQVALEKVTGNAVVESSHRKIKLHNVEGKVEVVGARGKIKIREASDEVSVRSGRAEVTIAPESPVRHDCRIINNRGNLNLQIPTDSDVRFQGAVDHGEVHCTIPSITVDQTTRGKHVISGQLGECTGTINLDIQRARVSIGTGNTEQPPGWDELEVG